MTCREENPPYEKLRSWLVFEGPIRQALHKIKYRRNFSLGEALARQFSGYVSRLYWPVDLIVPVPLGKQRMSERGYNQVGLVAMPLAAILNLQYAPRAVVRSRETRTQVGLSISERKENVAGAFLADRNTVSGKKVLLLDDVATTGATISACASSLLEAGARSVHALTLARALPHHRLKMV